MIEKNSWARSWWVLTKLYSKQKMYTWVGWIFSVIFLFISLPVLYFTSNQVIEKNTEAINQIKFERQNQSSNEVREEMRDTSLYNKEKWLNEVSEIIKKRKIVPVVYFSSKDLSEERHEKIKTILMRSGFKVENWKQKKLNNEKHKYWLSWVESEKRWKVEMSSGLSLIRYFGAFRVLENPSKASVSQLLEGALAWESREERLFWREKNQPPAMPKDIVFKPVLWRTVSGEGNDSASWLVVFIGLGLAGGLTLIQAVSEFLRRRNLGTFEPLATLPMPAGVLLFSRAASLAIIIGCFSLAVLGVIVGFHLYMNIRMPSIWWFFPFYAGSFSFLMSLFYFVQMSWFSGPFARQLSQLLLLPFQVLFYVMLGQLIDEGMYWVVSKDIDLTSNWIHLSLISLIVWCGVLLGMMGHWRLERKSRYAMVSL